MPDLLFLTQRLPYPPIKGEKIRQWRILNHLARWYDVHLGCLVDDPADLPHVDTVRGICRDMCAPWLDRKRAKLTCATGLLTNEPLSVTFFRDRALRDWVRGVATRVRPALTFVISSNMAPYILDLPRTGTRIVDFVDVDSEKFRSYAETARVPMRQVYRREWHRMAALERRIALDVDRSLFVSQAEADLFAAMVPERADRIHGLSNGVDHRYFDPGLAFAPPFDPAVPTFVFTGTMDYPPNVDAAIWFARDIMPAIRASLPQARFFIVGSNPSDDVKRLAGLEGISVTGPVPDVRPYLSHATAAVAPMRIARGIQNKVLEAMSMGKPVLATSGALEGIDATPGTDAVRADDADSFARAAIRLATSADGQPIGEAARRLILNRYDWDACLSRFDEFVRPPAGVTADTPTARPRNPIGAAA